MSNSLCVSVTGYYLLTKTQWETDISQHMLNVSLSPIGRHCGKVKSFIQKHLVTFILYSVFRGLEAIHPIPLVI